jgi:hypothetical protein
VDKNKDLIGYIQHYWLVYICEKLDLTRFLLPLPVVKTRKPLALLRKHKKSRSMDDVTNKKALSSVQSAVNNNSNNNSPTESKQQQAIEQDDEYEYDVGPPMLRPPQGWDIRSSQKSVSFFLLSFSLKCSFFQFSYKILSFPAFFLDEMGLGNRNTFQCGEKRRSSNNTEALVRQSAGINFNFPGIAACLHINTFHGSYFYRKSSFQGFLCPQLLFSRPDLFHSRQLCADQCDVHVV